MMKSGKNIIIVHGTKGSPDINWFRWLEKELKADGHTVYIPCVPTPENQSPERWLAALRDQAPAPDENTVLIGHSIGATFLLHLLETLPAPVAKTLFVSVVMDEINIPEYDTLNKPFLKTPDFDWLTISNNANDIALLHGENDPYVSKEHSEFLQDQIGGELVIIPNGGHLNSESAYNKFPEILTLIRQDVMNRYAA